MDAGHGCVRLAAIQWSSERVTPVVGQWRRVVWLRPPAVRARQHQAHIRVIPTTARTSGGAWCGGLRLPAIGVPMARLTGFGHHRRDPILIRSTGAARPVTH